MYVLHTTTRQLHSVYIVPILPATSLGVLLENIVAISGHRLQWPTGLKNVQQHFVSARKRVLKPATVDEEDGPEPLLNNYTARAVKK